MFRVLQIRLNVRSRFSRCFRFVWTFDLDQSSRGRKAAVSRCLLEGHSERSLCGLGAANPEQASGSGGLNFWARGMTWNDLQAVTVALGVLIAVFAFLLLAFGTKPSQPLKGRLATTLTLAHLRQMLRIRLSATAV